jgi:hypothetical protein
MKKFLSVLLMLCAIQAQAYIDIPFPASPATPTVVWRVLEDDVEWGYYISGDPWAKVSVATGVVTIIQITPPSTYIPPRDIATGGVNPGREYVNSANASYSPKLYETVASTINGSMINPGYDPTLSPVGTAAKQGFDRHLKDASNSLYRDYLNVGRPLVGGVPTDLSISNPLVVTAGSSLMSSKSYPKARYRPALQDMAILTVVPNALDTSLLNNSFRPPYCGTDKTHYWQKSMLNYGIFKTISTVGMTGIPSIGGLITGTNLNKPWTEGHTEETGRYWHAENNQPEYGGDTNGIAGVLARACLRMHLNESNATKEPLLIKIVQFGIDVYGTLKAGGYWAPNGGHNGGRKLPMVYAALALGDSNIYAYCNGVTRFNFQDDLQYWYVNAGDPARLLLRDPQQTGRVRVRYNADMIDEPEWGEKHWGGFSGIQRDGANRSAYYRSINYRTSIMTALAAQLTDGAVAAWTGVADPNGAGPRMAYFEYNDKMFEIVYEGTPSDWLTQMWTAGRALGDRTEYNPSIHRGATSIMEDTGSSSSVPDGGLLQMEFNRRITVGAGGLGTWTVSASGGAVSVSSVTAGGASVDLVLSRVILLGETVTVTYVPAVDGIKGLENGDALPAYTDASVDNRSQQTGGVVIPPDSTPPSPNPTTFSILPTGVVNGFTCTITTTTDAASNPVTYAASVNGVYGSWQSSPVVTRTDLLPNTAYTIQVKARDNQGNETTASVAQPVVTLAPAPVDRTPHRFPRSRGTRLLY